jgi:thioester reductase-like protein
MSDLLCGGTRLAVLVRPTDRDSAADRVQSALHVHESRLGRPISRPVCLAGDVNLPNFGLSHDAQRWLTRNCQRVIHNAAVLKFSAPNRQADPWKTNLEGTRCTLESCRRMGIRDFHYVSTAYVCGRRQGVIREDELEMGQAFRNDYEHSKYLAEQLVRNDQYLAPATVYRPVVISGDSQTGYTSTFHGINVYMRLLSTLMGMTQPGVDGRRYAPLRLPIQGDEGRNLVPVDWVSKVICHLLDLPAAHGRTFHLAPRVPITARQFFELVYEYFHADGVEFRGTDWRFGSDTSVFEKALIAHATIYKDYELTDPRFSTTNLNRFAGQLPCPVIDATVLRRYLRFGEQHGWGKRRSPASTVEAWAEDVLQSVLAVLGDGEFGELLGTRASSVGFDVVGPGGGQWQVSHDGFGRPALTPGLPGEGNPILRLSVPRLARVLGVSTKRPLHVVDGVSSARYFAHDRRHVKRIVRKFASRLTRDRDTAARPASRAG